MKRVKRVLALLAAFALVLAMAVPAFADEAKYKITIKNSVGTYEAYQIFKGDLEKMFCLTSSGARVLQRQARTLLKERPQHRWLRL